MSVSELMPRSNQAIWTIHKAYVGITFMLLVKHPCLPKEQVKAESSKHATKLASRNRAEDLFARSVGVALTSKLQGSD